MKKDHLDWALEAGRELGNKSLSVKVKADREENEKTGGTGDPKQPRLQVEPLRKEGKKQLKKDWDAYNQGMALLQIQLVTVCSVTPNVFDQEVWKQMATRANPNWTPLTADQLQIEIKREAEECRRKTVVALGSEEHNTISFDGTSMRGTSRCTPSTGSLQIGRSSFSMRTRVIKVDIQPSGFRIGCRRYIHCVSFVTSSRY